MRRELIRLVPAVVMVAVVLGVVSTLVIAALSGAFLRFGPDARQYPVGAPGAQSSGCQVPSVPGTVVSVRVAEMGGMMGAPDERGRWMGDWYRDGGNVAQAWPPGMGWMDMTISPTPVQAGEASLRVANLGWRPHELVVLPLTPGQSVGQRPVQTDGKINEAGSLGEVSASCAAGRGDGILPGATGWTTLTLAAGRYELACNYPGHYRAGMFAELDVI
jgi:uncharacterized cupredoxin-like copper-binding protein